MCACAPSDSAAISRRRNHEARWSPKKKARPSGRAWCCSREPAPDVRAPEIRIDQGRFCAVPERATAPGPGRSAAVSTSALNVSGMQKMLASLAGLAGPPVVIAPAAAPDSTIVRATLDPVNAPEVRWPQLVKPGDCVWPEQSAFDAHDSVSLMPALHLPVVALQIGQVWMNVLQVLLGQSASVTQPKPAFPPATQLPGRHEPESAQSPLKQHGVLVTSPPPDAQRPVSLRQVPPGHEPTAMVPQPPPPVQFAPGVVP